MGRQVTSSGFKKGHTNKERGPGSSARFNNGRPVPAAGLKQRKAKNKRNKLIIEFDEHDRTDYLTGFHKRKEERRKKAKEEEIQMLKEKKRQLKEKKKAEYVDHLKALKVAMDTTGLDPLTTASVVRETTHCTQTHTVTVTELDLYARVEQTTTTTTSGAQQQQQQDWSNEESNGEEECNDKSEVKLRKQQTASIAKILRRRERREKSLTSTTLTLTISARSCQQRSLGVVSRNNLLNSLVENSKLFVCIH